MRTILIADDEKIEREGIKFLLRKGNFDLNVVEAVHGKAALTYLKSNKVDILFTDVKMPFLDGLALTKEALNLYPDLKCIIFSGFSEFEFAKTAIQLGVTNYILKPVDKEEFNKTMQLVMDELEESERAKGQVQRNHALIKEHILYQLVNGVPKEKLMERLLGFEAFMSELSYNRMILIEFSKNFFENADENFVTNLRKEFQIPFFYLNLNMQQGLLFISNRGSLDYQVLAERMHEFIENCYKESCYLVVSEQFEDAGRIGDIYADMELKMESKFYQPENRVFTTKEQIVKEELWNDMKHSTDEDLRKAIIENIKNKDIASLNRNFDILCEKYREQADLSQIYVKFVFTTIMKEIINCLYISDEKLIGSEVEELYRSVDIETVIHIIKRYIVRFEESISGSDIRSEIQTIKNYIYGNYQNDISIETLAELVFRAPNYLRYIFKQETGYNLGKFIKAYRMKKAKEYLDNSQMKVVKVCELTGYTNVSYFCKNFKSYYGTSPEQYRKTGKAYEKENELFSGIETSE